MADSAVSVAVEGVERVQQDLARQRRDFYRAQRVQMGKALNVMRNEVRKNARATFTRRSGRLVRAIGRRIFDAGGPSITGQVAMFRRGYYGILETGGTINARRKPFLSFPVGGGRGEDFGGWVRVKSVHIPGRPFFAPAAAARQAQAVDILGSSFAVFTGTGERL